MEKERGIGGFGPGIFRILVDKRLFLLRASFSVPSQAGGAEVGDAATRPALTHFSSEGGIDSGGS